MKKTEIDYWITAMLESNPNVSDLNITVGKTLQVESSGVLVPVQVSRRSKT
jgi:twitching motility protein PilT